METLRLKTIQRPDQTLRLLESFAVEHLRMSPVSYRLLYLHELPAELRRHVGSGPEQHHAWLAWVEEGRTSLATGAMSLELARERGQPVLEVRHYEHHGGLVEFGTWVRAGTGRWERIHW